MSSEVKSSRATLYLGLIAVLTAVILIRAFYPKKSNNEPSPNRSNPRLVNGEEEISALGNPIARNPAISGSHDRLALLESFFSLDRMVVDRCLGTTMLNSKKFMLEENVKLTREFISQVKAYQSLQKLETFGQTVDQMMRTPVDIALDVQLEKLREFPGSGPVLASKRDSDLLSTFSQIISQRIIQLGAHKQIEDLKTVFENDWKQQFKRQGIEVSSPKDLPSKSSNEIQRVLRYWELSSTRFLLGISGNAAINEHIQEVFPGKVHPIYHQALNAVLDPAKRRFRTIATYMPQSATDPNPNGLFEVPDGQIALVEFTGALHRAKLFSDWQQGVNADTANDILYSPGFNPQAQILLRQDGLPEPERPAATINLPAVNIESIKTNRVVLKAPALDHNAILLLNDPFGPGWTVTIDGQTAEILRANNTARAVYLKPKKSVRTVEFIKRSSGR